jgi:murein peptide amidase A
VKPSHAKPYANRLAPASATLRFRLATACVCAAVTMFVSSSGAASKPLDRASTAAVKRVRIGRSVTGRPLRAFGFGNLSSRRKILVVGCIHGDERAGKRILRSLRSMAPPADLALWMIWSINPDGARAGTRQNARGVDLNRNFGYKWRPIGEPGDTYHSGTRKWSEPETRAARRFIRNRRPDLTIWYHQALALVVRTGPHRRVKARYARLVGLPLVRLAPLPGTAPRWQNHRFPGHASFVVELPGGRLSARAARRHARAVLAVGRM